MATVVALAVLSAAGALPVLVAVGPRWVSVALTPLFGAVVAALAATAAVAVGGPLLAWFVGLSVVGGAMAVAWWWFDPDGRPGAGLDGWSDLRSGVIGVGIFVAVAVTVAFTLRGLRTPTVGFDARALWVMRPGWLLQSHHQLLVDLRVRSLVLTQSAYPPLTSAAVAVGWQVTGVHTARLGVTVTSVLNACALAAAALAIVDHGRRSARQGESEGRADRWGWWSEATGVLSALLVVVIAGGVTEPFLTNGYADPIWSLAAVGAVAWGLTSPGERAHRSAAAVLVLVAGLSKNEGLVTASAIIGLILVRTLIGAFTERGREARWHRWLVPVAVAGAQLAAIGAWPVVMRSIGARGATSTFSTQTMVMSRSRAVAHGMAPYLHVLVVAVPVAVVGGLLLSGPRRRAAIGNDLWAWAALGSGLLAVAGALVTGQGAIGPWIASTVHRITEFPALAGWWIVATWVVVAVTSLGPAVPAPGGRATTGEPEERP